MFNRPPTHGIPDSPIKFRPIRPRSPHLNGKVERTQRSDLEEFWCTVYAKEPDVPDRLSEWQHHWNWFRPHTALSGASPIDRVIELLEQTPLWEEVDLRFEPSKERIRHQNYRIDRALAAVK